MSKLSLLATVTSVVKYDHVNSSGLWIEKLLFCKLEPKDFFNVHGNALKVVKKGGNENQIIEYLPDSLGENIASLMRQCFLKTIKAEITKELLQQRGCECKVVAYKYPLNINYLRTILRNILSEAY